MSNNISRVSLDDTLHLIQLMRETALAKGRQAQADRLDPVVDEMRGLAKTAGASAVQPSAAPSAPGILGQSDFKKLLEVSQSRVGAVGTGSAAAQPAASGSLSSTLERNRLVASMAAAKMSDVEIARQFGMSRDEVRLILNVQNTFKSSNEVIK